MFSLLLQITFITLFVACALTPGVYSLLQEILGPDIWPFSRVYNRVAMVSAAIVLWIYRKKFSLGPLKEYLNKERIKQEYKLALAGLVIAACCALVFLPYYVAAGELAWSNETLAYWLKRIPKVLAGALLISIIEESFFRGLVFNNLKRASTVLFAYLITNVFYASVHFIRPVKSWEYPGFSLTSGFEYLGQVFKAAADPALLPSFVGLFLVGLVLCRIMEKTGSLVLCIGLHMGWVIAIKMSVYLTDNIPGFVYEGGRRYFLVGKPLVWSSVVLVFALVSIYLWRGRQGETSIRHS